MEDLSLHILDVVENSIRAGASEVNVRLTENRAADLLILEIGDDGEGMDEATAKRCVDPFYTTKSGKKVGLGLPFRSQSAEEAGGELVVKTAKGKGKTSTLRIRGAESWMEDGRPGRPSRPKAAISPAPAAEINGFFPPCLPP